MPGVGYPVPLGRCANSALSATPYPACPELRGEPCGVRYPFPRFWLAAGHSPRLPHGPRPAPYLPLESTLAKVYQNKKLYLPLESTLVKNPGEGVPTRTSAPDATNA